MIESIWAYKPICYNENGYEGRTPEQKMEEEMTGDEPHHIPQILINIDGYEVGTGTFIV